LHARGACVGRLQWLASRGTADPQATRGTLPDQPRPGGQLARHVPSNALTGRHHDGAPTRGGSATCRSDVFPREARRLSKGQHAFRAGEEVAVARAYSNRSTLLNTLGLLVFNTWQECESRPLRHRPAAKWAARRRESWGRWAAADTSPSRSYGSKLRQRGPDHESLCYRCRVHRSVRILDAGRRQRRRPWWWAWRRTLGRTRRRSFERAFGRPRRQLRSCERRSCERWSREQRSRKQRSHERQGPRDNLEWRVRRTSRRSVEQL